MIPTTFRLSTCSTSSRQTCHLRTIQSTGARSNYHHHHQSLKKYCLYNTTEQPTRHRRHKQQQNNIGTRIVRYNNNNNNCTFSLQTVVGSTNNNKRYLSSNSNSKPTTVWARQAIAVKNTDFENSCYLDAIRAEHDPSLHVKTIEDELKGTIGKALGKQGEKIQMYINLMNQERIKYEQCTNKKKNSDGTSSSLTSSSSDEQGLNQIIQKYNEYRKAALHARWELLVHRQAAGFVVNNHQIVMEHYPISDPLVLDVSCMSSSSADQKTTNNDNNTNDSRTRTNMQNKSTSFGDQLDWWQRIGRWK